MHVAAERNIFLIEMLEVEAAAGTVAFFEEGGGGGEGEGEVHSCLIMYSFERQYGDVRMGMKPFSPWATLDVYAVCGCNLRGDNRGHDDEAAMDS